jgi:hypothetical protein
LHEVATIAWLSLRKSLHGVPKICQLIFGGPCSVSTVFHTMFEGVLKDQQVFQSARRAPNRGFPDRSVSDSDVFNYFAQVFAGAHLKINKIIRQQSMIKMPEPEVCALRLQEFGAASHIFAPPSPEHRAAPEKHFQHHSPSHQGQALGLPRIRVWLWDCLLKGYPKTHCMY